MVCDSKGLDKLGATCVLTGEAMSGEYPDDVTPFLADGVVVLKLDSMGSEVTRTLTVRKMRLTDANTATNNLDINPKKGLVVQSA